MKNPQRINSQKMPPSEKDKTEQSRLIDLSLSH
ncbi:hypothetical protein GGD41_002207 [Paraburkholderia bryophila]|uniref:Uncharacterized protein n=1 Tax=Paraburkholderia bryophila TaxID=420952 RepID=A0A7Y9W680_9BURK|nr:hypothetical protein [Paraburkholderia bryophila]